MHMPESTTHLEDLNVNNQVPLCGFLFHPPSLIPALLSLLIFNIHVHTYKILCLIGLVVSSGTRASLDSLL